MNTKRKTLLPRDGAGSFSFPPEAGQIKHMLGLEGFMEIYTVHATYRVKAPDHLDPSRTIPDMPWSQSAHGTVGASNPIVARILIQSIEALGNWQLRNGNANTIKRHLHACKEEAIICEAAYNKLKPAYDAVVTQIKARKVNMQRNMVECPSVSNLRDEAATFLTSAKRALQCVGEVFNQFYVPDGKKPMVSNANFGFAIARLESERPVNKDFLDYIKKSEYVIKRFVDLRNGLEHQNETDFTFIENFHLTPKAIAAPSWRSGSLVVEGPVLEEMHFFLQFLIDFCESVFFFGLLDNITPTFSLRFQVEHLADDKIDPDCPVRFRLQPLLK